MSFWEFIVGAAQKSWERKPRKDVIRSLVELRDAMTSCHKAYADYSQLLAAGSYKNEIRKRRALATTGVAFRDPLEVWEDSVFRLGDVLFRIGPLLDIFSPQTSKSVSAYYHSEPIVKPARLEAAHGYIDKRFDDIAKAIQQQAPSFDEDAPRLDGSFEEALANLDEFIKQHFKLEEIYRAQQQS